MKALFGSDILIDFLVGETKARRELTRFSADQGHPDKHSFRAPPELCLMRATSSPTAAGNARWHSASRARTASPPRARGEAAVRWSGWFG